MEQSFITPLDTGAPAAHVVQCGPGGSSAPSSIQIGYSFRYCDGGRNDESLVVKLTTMKQCCSSGRKRDRVDTQPALSSCQFFFFLSQNFLGNQLVKTDFMPISAQKRTSGFHHMNFLSTSFFSCNWQDLAWSSFFQIWFSRKNLVAGFIPASSVKLA